MQIMHYAYLIAMKFYFELQITCHLKLHLEKTSSKAFIELVLSYQRQLLIKPKHFVHEIEKTKCLQHT